MTADSRTGFLVRPGRPGEGPAVEALLAAALGGPVGLGAGTGYLGAFAVADSRPLGGLAVRRAVTDGGPSFAQFRIGVPPPYRRHGIGTGLVTSLYRLADAAGMARLTLAELVHDPDPVNGFARRLGLVPERSLVRYAAAPARVLAATAAFAARAGGLDLVSTADVDPDAVGRLVAANFGGFADRWAADLRGGRCDPRLSVAAVRDGRVAAAGLAATDGRTVEVHLVVVAPDERLGPAAAAVVNAMTRRTMAAGITHSVWDGDPEHDRFAASVARRTGATPVGVRHRYAVDAAAVRVYLAGR